MEKQESSSESCVVERNLRQRLKRAWDCLVLLSSWLACGLMVFIMPITLFLEAVATKDEVRTGQSARQMPQSGMQLAGMSLSFRQKGTNAAKEQAPGPEVGAVTNAPHALGGSMPRERGKTAEGSPALGREALERAHLLHAGGMALRDLRKHADALDCFKEELGILRKHLSAGHPDIVSCLNDLGAALLALGRQAEARACLNEAAEFARKGLPAGHPERARSLECLGDAGLALGERDEALAHYREARHQREMAMDNVFGSSDEAHCLAWRMGFDPFSGIATCGDGPELAAATLRFKGIVLDAVARCRAVAMAHDPGVRGLVRERSGLRRGLQEAAMEGGPGRLSRAEYDRMSGRLEDIERELAKKVAGYAAARRSLSAGLADVQKALPEGAALVEMVAYWRYRPKEQAERRYAAAVIRRGGEPVFADLGSAAEVEAQMRLVREGIMHIHGLERDASDPVRLEMRGEARVAIAAMASERRGDFRGPLRELHRLLVEPVEKALGKEGARTLILCPDGQLNFVPFAALVDAEGRFLCERYEIRMVSTGRDLVVQEAQAEGRRTAVLVGDPDLGNAGPREAVSPEPSAPSSSSKGPGSSVMLVGLPGTAEEIDGIGRRLEERGWAVARLVGPLATEASVRAVCRPSVLHFATHSWFLPEVGASKDGPVDGPGRMELGGMGESRIKPMKPQENPMLRAGLALSGAQTTLDLWMDGHVPPPDRDGILMGAEVEEMDLRGTDLVVLNCGETALGQVVDGEGVLGLRRAFAVAGARNLLMTLWAVSDSAARDLLPAFYRQVVEGGIEPSRALWRLQRDALVYQRERIGLDLAVRHLAPFVLTSSGKVPQPMAEEEQK